MLSLLVSLQLSTATASTAPGFDDPILFPPDVLEDEPADGGEVRTSNGGALVLAHTDVLAEVSAGLARVTLTQWFRNPYDEPIDATYLLPLPPGAAVDRMDLVVGDRLIEGFVAEKEVARELYEEARAGGRKAALLEQKRENLFRQSIAGLCPDEEVVVTIQYVEQVPYEDEIYSLALPTTVGRRYSAPWVEDAAEIDVFFSRTGRTVDVEVQIEEGMPVASIWSDSHDVDIEDGPVTVVTTAEWDRSPTKDFALSWALAGEQPRVALVTHRALAGEAGYLALTLEPQVLDDLFQPRPRELLFVIDESCSMSGTPYVTAGAAVLLALEKMSPRDTFNLLRFSDDAGQLFASSRPSTPETRKAARDWLGTFLGGGTRMEYGIVHALDQPAAPGRMRLVLMLTDGFVGGEDHIFGLVRAHLGDARLFSLGVGSSVNRYLLEGLAEMGRGDAIYQLPGTPLHETVAAFYGRIAHPAMTDVRVDWGGAAVFEQYPRTIPDLWAGQPVRVVARFREAGPATVRVTGFVGEEAYEVELPVDLPTTERDHEGVAALWARRKIRDLEWYPRGKSAEEVRAAVTNVALNHHLVSTYTSLVAVDDEPCPCGTSRRTVEVPQEGIEGNAVGHGGLGLKGTGSGGGGYGYGMGRGVLGHLGTSGYGTGGTEFGAKGEGGVGAVRGEPIILGALDKTLVDGVIKRHLNQVRYCYQRELTKDAALAGKIQVKFVIAADGSVSRANVVSSTMANPTVESCILNRFLQFQFPAPQGGGVVVVSYPFLFAPG